MWRILLTFISNGPPSGRPLFPTATVTTTKLPGHQKERVEGTWQAWRVWRLPSNPCSEWRPRWRERENRSRPRTQRRTRANPATPVSLVSETQTVRSGEISAHADITVWEECPLEEERGCAAESEVLLRFSECSSGKCEKSDTSNHLSQTLSPTLTPSSRVPESFQRTTEPHAAGLKGCRFDSRRYSRTLEKRCYNLNRFSNCPL